MPLTKDELRFWSRRIRMSFVRSRGDEDNEDARTYRIDDMNGFLSSLKNTFIDQEVLQYSRIHTALMAMKAVKSMHSERVEQEIEDMLKSWEKRLGCLDGIQADLYGPGGRLCGLTKWKREEHYLLNAMKDDAWWAEREFFRTKNPGIIWEIQGGKGLIHSMKTGHNGFQVGDWWIKVAAAFRDGIVHDSSLGITADDSIAYAIMMTDNEELAGDEKQTTYKTSEKDPGRFKLMNNMTSQHLVRVLRTWRLNSEFAPTAGVRYDGLYRVIGYRVRLLAAEDGDDKWEYIFDLSRDKDQPSLAAALCHPKPDELDDWQDYQRTEEGSRATPESLVSIAEHGEAFAWLVSGDSTPWNGNIFASTGHPRESIEVDPLQPDPSLDAVIRGEEIRDEEIRAEEIYGEESGLIKSALDGCACSPDTD